MKNLLIIGFVITLSGCRIQFMDPPQSNVAEVDYAIQACQQYCEDNGTSMDRLEGTTCICHNQKGPVFDFRIGGE